MTVLCKDVGSYPTSLICFFNGHFGMERVPDPFKMNPGKIIEFCFFFRFSHILLLRIFSCTMYAISHCHFILILENAAGILEKIMDFHFGKWLDTLGLHWKDLVKSVKHRR